MLQLNWPVVDTIHSYSNNFVMGVKIKGTSESKLKQQSWHAMHYHSFIYHTVFHLKAN